MADTQVAGRQLGSELRQLVRAVQPVGKLAEGRCSRADEPGKTSEHLLPAGEQESRFDPRLVRSPEEWLGRVEVVRVGVCPVASVG